MSVAPLFDWTPRKHEWNSRMIWASFLRRNPAIFRYKHFEPWEKLFSRSANVTNRQIKINTRRLQPFYNHNMNTHAQKFTNLKKNGGEKWKTKARGTPCLS